MVAEDAAEYAKVSCCEGGGCAKAWRPAPRTGSDMRRSRVGFPKGMRAMLDSVGKRWGNAVWVWGALMGGGKEN